MKIVSITAGAAGMYCGSCMRDNTLSAALRRLGHDALLVPVFTPIRTDDPDVSSQRVFLGGVRVYLVQKFPWLAKLPNGLLNWLDSNWILNAVAGRGSTTPYAELGDLTLSMLDGTHGAQRASIEQLVDWLAAEGLPDAFTLTNVLLSGIAPHLKQRTNKPILAYLQGDDIFLDALPEPFQQKALAAIRTNAQHIDGFIATSRDYADRMAVYLGLPREKIGVVYPGIRLEPHLQTAKRPSPGPVRIGYFARIAPEKGLHLLAEAYAKMRQAHPERACELRVAGWLGPQHQGYFEGIRQRLADAGFGAELIHTDCPDLASKLDFYAQIDLFCVPAPYREPKGLYLIEALAHGIPAIQPRHGSFPELLERAPGGVLVPPDDTDALADALGRLAGNADYRKLLGDAGRAGAIEALGDETMAHATVDHLKRYLP